MTEPRFHAWFSRLVAEHGSDLHLAAGRPPAIRSHGEVLPIPGEPPLEDARLRAMMREVVDDVQWSAFDETGDLDFAYEMTGTGRFRGNYLEQETGAGAVFRLVPENIIPMEELGLPAVVGTLADLESGLVLVTGPTGSGKSTTLASIIDLINRKHSRHIVTIEDPLEFVHQNKRSILSHREVGRDTGSFASALRAALRADADVVLVGELRDPETISLAIEGAGMGILVFGTLHTSSAAKTVDRIVTSFPADQQP
ncbi:MAG TPA: ATPase, T2SS/T4P/T4SS family, partial [Polyangiaceae bacterium]|nr:ATPase, T2SS/T4P/T4SS family [Polyangiaceae bacterium]